MSTASWSGEKAATGMFDAGLDQFGPHSRIIGPTGVESSYNFDRGGDIDEVRIYDRALSDDNVASLAKGEIPQIDSAGHADRPHCSRSHAAAAPHRRGNPSRKAGSRSGGTTMDGIVPAIFRRR